MMLALLLGTPAIAREQIVRGKCDPDVDLCPGERPDLEEILHVNRVCLFTSFVREATGELLRDSEIRANPLTRTPPNNKDDYNEDNASCTSVAPVVRQFLWGAFSKTHKKSP